VQDGLTYTEQSNSAKKLAERFDPQQIDMIKRQLAAEHPDLKDKIEKFEIRHIAMLNTAQFGVRGSTDGSVDTGDIHDKAKGTRFGKEPEDDKVKAAKEEADFKGAVEGIVQQQKRGDVVGVDIAGAEQFTFDDKGAKRFAYLYDQLLDAARKRGEPIVLRPHVGEGANDPETGKSFHRDADRQMANGEITGRTRAKDNLDALIITLDDIAKAHGGKLPPEVIVRFGHATALTPDQAVMMAKLGIIAEVNLSSNIETGASSQRDPASKTKDNPRPEGQAPLKDNDPRRGGRLDDHSLATMIMNGVPVILSTDGHSVMSTNMKREYDLANQQIDRILKSRQPIPMTMEQAKALGVKNLKPDDRGNVMVKLKDIPAAKQGEIIKKFSDARAKFYDDANNYFDKRPKQGPGDDENGPAKVKGDDDGSVKKTQIGGMEEGPTANSETPGFEVEKHNTDDHRERAKVALGRLSAAEQTQVQALMDNAPTQVQKNMLERAIAAGRSAGELEQLRAYMSTLGGDDAVARALSGAGVIQFYAHSCVPSAYQTAIADVDPFYAFQLRMNPELIMDQQRFVLALNGTQQKQRPDVEHEQLFKDTNTPITPNLQEHLNDKSMGTKLRDQNSYGPGNSNDQGMEPTALKGSDLHAQLEKATGRKYEVLANASLPFKKQGDGHFPDGQAPHDRIMAAVDLHLPVIIGQQFDSGQIDPQTGKAITTGHAVVIVAYQKIGVPPDQIIRYTTRDPGTGKTDVILDTQMDSLGTSTVTVPHLGPVKKTTAGDETSSSVKKPVADGDEKSTKIGAVDEEKNAKPAPETFADAHDRRSQGVKPKNPEHESSFASPNDRKGVAKEVPLSRQELRELLVAKYGEFLKPWLEAKHTQHEDWLPLIKELQQIETGAGGKDKTLGPKYEEKFRELSAKIAEKEAANGKKKELDDIQLRSFYNLVEKEEMRSAWHPELKNLPPEQVAKLMSMYREELKLFVRDLMQDDNATEVLYQRDRIVYGDRKGPQFDELVNKKVAMDTSADTLDGKEGKAYKGIVDSSMRSNEEMNLKLTGYKDGIDPEVGKKIRQTAQDPTKTLPEIQKANAQQAEADKAKTKTGSLGDQTTAISKAKNETEQADSDKIQSSTEIIKDKLGLDTPKYVPPPEGKPVLKQSPSDALISLPIDVISPTASGADSIKKFQDDGIPRWGALSEKERMHESKFANAVEAKLPAFVDEFLAMSKSGETYKFEVDGAKKLYGAYGKAMDVKDTANGGISSDQMEVRATANHALHPTAVAIARLAFLKHIDTMQPGEQIFVTNGGCASGKGSLFGVAAHEQGKNPFGAVGEAAGGRCAQEKMGVPGGTGVK